MKAKMLLVSAALVLAGCGGGGSAADTAPQLTVQASVAATTVTTAQSLSFQVQAQLVRSGLPVATQVLQMDYDVVRTTGTPSTDTTTAGLSRISDGSDTYAGLSVTYLPPRTQPVGTQRYCLVLHQPMGYTPALTLPTLPCFDVTVTAEPV